MRALRAPASGAEPLLHFALSFIPVAGRALRGLLYPFAVSANVFGERTESDCTAPFVDMVGIFERQRAHFAVRVPVVLRAVALLSSFVDADAVVEHCKFAQRRFALCGGGAHQLECTSLQCGLTDGVLHDEPRGMGAIGTDLRTARPAVALENRCESRRIATMD